ncbi:hypothetical protein [Wolbachia endosymbiont of Trichogramma kaykai]
MVDKECNNTKVYYDALKSYLNDDGKIKDCGDNQECKELYSNYGESCME